MSFGLDVFSVLSKITCSNMLIYLIVSDENLSLIIILNYIRINQMNIYLMKKVLSLMLVVLFTTNMSAQKKTRLNKGSNVVKTLVSDPEDIATEIAVGEIFEQGVTEWVLKTGS